MRRPRGRQAGLIPSRPAAPTRARTCRGESRGGSGWPSGGTGSLSITARGPRGPAAAPASNKSPGRRSHPLGAQPGTVAQDQQRLLREQTFTSKQLRPPGSPARAIKESTGAERGFVPWAVAGLGLPASRSEKGSRTPAGGAGEFQNRPPRTQDPRPKLTSGFLLPPGPTVPGTVHTAVHLRPGRSTLRCAKSKDGPHCGVSLAGVPTGWARACTCVCVCTCV